MNCKHCNGRFTCGCQKSTAKDGSTVHKTCLKAYNNSKSNQSTLRTFTDTVNYANQNLGR